MCIEERVATIPEGGVDGPLPIQLAQVTRYACTHRLSGATGHRLLGT